MAATTEKPKHETDSKNIATAETVEVPQSNWVKTLTAAIRRDSKRDGVTYLLRSNVGSDGE